MSHSSRSIIHIFLLLSFVASGCINTRFLKNDEKLFTKNKINFQTEEKKIKDSGTLKREIKELSQLQPNQKLLGLFKTRLWFYNVSNKPKETKFRYWMKNKVGEAPVLLNENLAEKSTLMMRSYLVNKGFFYAKINYHTELKKKKAKVFYDIDAGHRYKFNKIEFVTDSSLKVSYLIKDNSDESLLEKGQPFDVNTLKQERERIAEDVRDQGYYLFNKDMILYDLDSSDASKNMNVYVNVATPSDSLDHRKFYINNVYIYTDFTFEQFSDSTTVLDTLKRGYFYIIYQKDLLVKPYTLLSSIYFKRGDLYKKTDVQRTVFNLTDLGVFKFINVKFEQHSKDSLDFLDCSIFLTPAKKQEITTTFELNNNTYNLLGFNINLGYLNKNIFTGAERFQFDITGGAETNFDGSPFFNTTDLNVSTSLLFNKFLIPFRIKNLAKSTRPKTRVSIKLSYLNRIDNFTILSGNISYGYEWRKRNGRHLFNIMNISLVRAPFNTQSDEFRQLLVLSPSLRNSFSEQLIIGMNHTYTWTQKLKSDTRHQLFFRINNETAGNFIDGITAIIDINKENTIRPRDIFNINYAQYYKIEGDFRYYYDIGKVSRIANRLFLGVGIPYGNSQILPYIKQYFSGGSVSLRGWTVRSLGPGSYNYRDSPEYNSRFLDQTGDIKFEASSELRFNMIKFIKGAVFLDAGNVWLAREDTTRPGANFDAKRFYKEIALGSGFGIRADLSYFVFRFDIGFQIHDPTVSQGTKWVIRNINFVEDRWLRNHFKFNIALGYPF